METTLSRAMTPRTRVALPSSHLTTMTAPRTHAAWITAAALTARLTASQAHGLDAGHVQIVLHDRVAEIVATPSVSLVAWADVDHDGRLTLDEVNARRDAIRRALVDGIDVTDGDGARAEVERSDVSLPRADDGSPAGRDFLRLTVVLRWPQAPSSLRVRCALVTDHPVTVMATRAVAATPGVLTLDGEPSFALLSRADETATLFAAPAAAVTAPTPAPVTVSPPTPRRGWWIAASLAALTFAASRIRRRIASGAALTTQGES